jgi:hypothetical protein
MQAPSDGARAWATIAPELDSFLDDPFAREWLRACALYPGLRWDITLYLGLKLKDAAGAPLFTEERATKLCQLPWFRTGMMPDWVRKPLILELSPARRKEAIALLGELYGRAGYADEIQDTPGRVVINLPVAIGGREARLDVRSNLGAAASDTLFLDVLQKEDIAAFEAPRRLLTLLSSEDAIRSDTWKSFLWREGQILSIYALYTAAAIWFVPKPWEGPWTTSAWSPFLVLFASGMLAWAGHAWLFSRSKAAR